MTEGPAGTADADPTPPPVRVPDSDRNPTPDTAAQEGAESSRAGQDKAEQDTAGSSGRGGRARKSRSLWKEIPILIVVALVLSVVLQTFIARVYLIPSQSMEPTLHGCPGCTGDRILVDKLSYRFTDPRAGDVVVFKGPPSWDNEFVSNRSKNVVIRGLQNIGSVIGLVPPDENDLVKRIIATGGQTVQCLPGDAGIKVNGKVLNEPYRKNPPTPLPGADSPCQGPYFGPVTVPKGDYWVMGDNRTNSADSRYHMGDDLQGTVPRSDIIGKARFIVLPPSRWGSISSPNPQS
ncbi:signal peptidase I [Speluncibacter jeojiensis]|uniref:Signal peptidase I n=1 Tax=Speluncibacter jeojiensis TaxID=2710754 RepID=A0A9X4LZ86_9ACTN|nr:signal peptidase I [Corynebacteriales bacterium D3-21]